ncbi:MAG: DUF362 domain-containing protein [Theionarchaea archaeon]|nr:DUF362 domain-containing protein [Theionarchaea archaeon]
MGSVLIIDTEYETVDEAVQKVFNHFNPPEEDVLIKPNLLGGFPPEQHVTTHPSLVRALVSYCEKKNITITVGDNPAGRGNLVKRANRAGLYEASQGHFQDISEGKDIIADSEFFSKLVISRKVLQSSYIINVPKFKTHLQTIITGALKNMFGVLPGEEKSMIHASARSLESFSRALVDIYSVRPPDLTVMDAIVGMEGNGPSSGKLRHIGKILASDNAVELDAVMAYMMGLNPSEVPMLRYAHEKQLGEIRVEKIEIEGEMQRIPGFKVPSKALVRFITPLTSRYYDFLAVKPRLAREKCVRCWECVEKCPVSALRRNEYPHITKECVSCFCCVEVCENHAMEVSSRARDLFNRSLLKI